MPLWTLLALVVPFSLGVVNVVDKLIVERHAPTVFIYVFWIGVLEICVGSVILISVSSGQPDARALWGGLIAGGFRGASLIALLTALRHGQLSRVSPVYFLFPLMVAPMSWGFLGEDLSSLAWGAIALAVAGAGLVTWQGRAQGGVRGQPKAQLYAVAGAFMFAVSNVFVKWFLEEEPFWEFYSSTRVGVGIVMMSALLTADVRGYAMGMVRNRTFMALVLTDDVIASSAILAGLAAIDRGPLSLVSAVWAIQPAVVLGYSFALARAYPGVFGGWVTSANLTTQVAGIAAILTAVLVITLE